MRHLIAVCLLVSIPAAAQSVDDRVDKLVKQMTLEEKVGQLMQYTPDEPGFSEALQKGLVGSILNGGDAVHINELQRAIIANSRLHIPLLVGHDVIHGYRTIFPIPLAIASSWNPAMAELTSRVAAREARATGIRWTFAPMVDIARDPRWGRIAEGAGEDPVLGSAMAAAYVRGFQGSNLASNDSLLACAKHYAVYGAAEGGRDYNTAEVSERTVREVYLPPFHAAVDAGAGTLMSAFESLNGVPASANKHLLDDILRREWKFRGFVVSDWDAVDQLRTHGVAATKDDAAIKAITAGVDMDMHDGDYATLIAAVHDGRIAEAVIDQSVRRILRAKFLVGLFDDPYTDPARAAAATLTSENRSAARRVASSSIVLLKNDGDLLPLPKTGRSIAVVGKLANSKQDMIGPWAAEGKGEDAVSFVDGLREVVPSIRYTDDMNVARESDLIIAIAGEDREMSGEAESRSSIDLPADQQKLLDDAVATGKPVVLVVVSGRPLAISWAAAHVAAIVESWFLGTEAGHALADVLFGDVNPSAKLPVTVPRATGQVPIYYAHLPTGRPADANDKYTSKYIDLPLGPLYPFGFGLSYSKFDYSNLQISSPAMKVDGRVTVSADVRNSGGRAGDEIVEFYVGDPVASLSRPVKELKAFQRITLSPGQTRHVEFTVTRHELEFWNDGWTVEPGEFNVWIAPDSERGLKGTFTLTAK